MHENQIVGVILFVGFFLVLTTLVKWWSERSSFPYTVALLLAGFVAQVVFHAMGIDMHLSLSTDMIFFVLLPLLLFESATHIQLHQFRLQFKTITFLATFGLLLSVFVTGALMALLLGIPFGVGLLFGAIISSTDPIAVLSLFKSIKAPKRLALLIEGESMFNDATAVIVFRIISAIVVGHSAFYPQHFAASTLNFLYVFIGSIVAGAIMAAITSIFIEKVENDRIIETTLTVGLALGSFVISEHFFGLSGVIATVSAGLVLGNIGKTRISTGVVEFMNEFWEYIGFIAVSLVFFFATFNLDPTSLTDNLFKAILVIGAVVIARFASVYGSFFISNRLPLFKDEPNVPLEWQHIINWGGLRGVIPLVLVYAIPDDFAYKEMLIGFTLDVFLYSVIVHGLSVGTIMKRLGLDKPARSHEIKDKEDTLFEIKRAKSKLSDFRKHHMSQKVVDETEKKLRQVEQAHTKKLLDLASLQDLEDSLCIQAIHFERKHLRKLFERGYLSEGVYFEFEAELDLQEDAIEYPNLNPNRVVDAEGKIKGAQSFRKKIRELTNSVSRWPLISQLPLFSREKLVHERLELLWVRIICGKEAIAQFEEIEGLFGRKVTANRVIEKVKKEYLDLVNTNRYKVHQLQAEFPQYVTDYFTEVVESFVLKDIK
jgi:CPA1 family monovalent cation:H+ antiporter